MKSALSGFLAAAGVAGLLVSAMPVSAQMSPAQMKAQRDRAAQAAAARAQADRERSGAAARAASAARARELAEQRQRALKLAAERRERARKLALYAEARNQAVTTGRISAGYMFGAWAFANPGTCKPDEDADHRTHFDDDGTYSGYEEGGKWSAAGGNLIWDYTDYDDNKIHQVEKVAGLSLNSFVTEMRGGHEIWFRCGESAAMIPDAASSKSRFPEPDYQSYDGQWELASVIDDSWGGGKFPEAFRTIERFLAAYPKTTRETSRIKNYAGLYQWRQVGNLRQAAGWFLQNYQNDPAGERAADSLLSLAQVMHEMGDVPRYCLALKQLMVDYPFDAKYRLEPRISIVSKLATCA